MFSLYYDFCNNDIKWHRVFASANDGTGNGSYTPDTNPQVGVRYGRNYNGITVNRAYDNTAYTIEKWGRKRSWNLQYTHLDATDKSRLEALFEYTEGRKNGFSGEKQIYYPLDLKVEKREIKRFRMNLYNNTDKIEFNYSTPKELLTGKKTNSYQSKLNNLLRAI